MGVCLCADCWHTQTRGCRNDSTRLISMYFKAVLVQTLWSKYDRATAANKNGMTDYGCNARLMCRYASHKWVNSPTKLTNSQCYDFVGFELHHAMPAFFRSILRVSEVFSPVVYTMYVHL